MMARPFEIVPAMVRSDHTGASYGEKGQVLSENFGVANKYASPYLKMITIKGNSLR